MGALETAILFMVAGSIMSPQLGYGMVWGMEDTRWCVLLGSGCMQEGARLQELSQV